MHWAIEVGTEMDQARCPPFTTTIKSIIGLIIPVACPGQGLVYRIAYLLI